MTKSPAALLNKLGHEFADTTLLEQALTHCSAGSKNNERLEFLGDAVLDCVISDELFQRYPQAREGELSRLRASLVRRDSLAAVAQTLDIGQYLHLGTGERRSGGHHRDSILSDALEALLGAIYLDGGYAACRGCILGLFADLLDNPSTAAALKDAKTRLQEHLQAHHLALPEYRVIEVTGDAHDQFFRVECVVGDSQPTQGQGRSRRFAEQGAAEQMLLQLTGG
ncbi:MAG: ribonuclease III [Gammaproteobacteria bacterium]